MQSKPKRGESIRDVKEPVHSTLAAVFRTTLASALPWLWAWLPPLGIMATIFWFSSQPTLPSVPGYWLDALLKKASHVAIFTLLFLLFVRAWRSGRTSRQTVSIAILSTAAYAISDELHQAFVPGRHCNWYDVAIDLSGALIIGLLLRGGLSLPFLRGGDVDLPE